MPEVPTTPVGVTLALAKGTQQDAAKRAKSRALPPWVNRILDSAAKGEAVDAFKFQVAVRHVMALAATRAGQSMSRRVYVREARLLAEVAESTVHRALTGKVKIDPAAVAKAVADTNNGRLVEEIDHLTRIARQRRIDLNAAEAEIAQLREAVQDQAARADDNYRAMRAAEIEMSAQADGWRGAARDRDLAQTLLDRTSRVLNYALRHLSPTDVARVDGFRDAVENNA